MKEILQNIALIDCINFCKENNLDCSGTYVRKFKRGYSYELVREKDEVGMLTVTFHKHSIPTHFIHKIY